MSFVSCGCTAVKRRLQCFVLEVMTGDFTQKAERGHLDPLGPVCLCCFSLGPFPRQWPHGYAPVCFLACIFCQQHAGLVLFRPLTHVTPLTPLAHPRPFFVILCRPLSLGQGAVLLVRREDVGGSTVHRRFEARTPKTALGRGVQHRRRERRQRQQRGARLYGRAHHRVAMTTAPTRLPFGGGLMLPVIW